MQYGATSAPADSSAALGDARLTIGITGGSGFVGRELITRLTAAGHSIRLATRSAARTDALRPLSSVEIAVGNVYDPAFLDRVLDGCDAAINLVGILNERGFGGGGFRRAHVELTAELLRAMRRMHVRRLLQMSALNADTQGRSHYLRTKGEAEGLVRNETGLQWTILRPSVIFGAGDSLTVRFASLLRLSAGALPLARAQARFAPIHVRDVAWAFERALNDSSAIGSTYELCGPDVLTLAQLVRETARIAGLPCHLLALPDVVAWLQGVLMGLIPGKPFSLDNYRSLLTDSVCADNGCERLGVRPGSLRAWAPLWLQSAQLAGKAPAGRPDHA